MRFLILQGAVKNDLVSKIRTYTNPLVVGSLPWAWQSWPVMAGPVGGAAQPPSYTEPYVPLRM
jgi:hypothetical protein